MHNLQKMSNEDLDILIEQLKDDIDKLEFKIDIGSVSQFALESYAWKKYHYYLSILLQIAKDEKKRRTNDSKRINKRTTKD
jgi:hypothetical protein